MEFINKQYLYLLLAIPIVVFLYYIASKKNALKFKFIEDIKQAFGPNYLFWGKIVLLIMILVNFILFLANPNKTNIEKNIEKNGIDIAFVLDVSDSMNAEDLKPTRLEAAKNMINQFLSKIENDRVGLVIFAGKPFVSIPLTFDKEVVKEGLKNIQTSTINQQNNDLAGTAIGDALVMGKTLFNNSGEKRQKVIILLTDGDNNVGPSPVQIAPFLKKYGIKVYTIGIGSRRGGYIKYNVGPFTQYAKVPPLKEGPLRQVAQITNGKFFRATNNQTLKQIFDELAKLTKTKVKVKQQKTYQPYYNPFLYSLIILLALFSFIKIKEI